MNYVSVEIRISSTRLTQLKMYSFKKKRFELRYFIGLFTFVFETENLNIYQHATYNATSSNVMKYSFKQKT